MMARGRRMPSAPGIQVSERTAEGAASTLTALMVEQQRRRRPADMPHTAYTAQASDECLAELCALAERLAEWRRQSGATIKALASRFGVSRATVTRAVNNARLAPTRGMTTRMAARLRMRLLAWLDTLDTLDRLEERASSNTATQTRSSAPFIAAPHSQNTVASVTAPEVSTRRTLATYRVLILENDPDILDIYRLALAEAVYEPESYAARYEAQVVSTLDECLTALATAQRMRAPFDTLIMDLRVRNLPPHTGQPSECSTGARRLIDSLLDAEALLPRGRLVVSGMAPYHLRQVSARLARLGAAYLPKPFDIGELLAGIYSLCAPGMRPAASLSFFA